ncbi:MAG: DoxX family protein [Cyanobacteria bacterium P01_G01_bin.38]
MNQFHPAPRLKAADISLAYALLRIIMGINYFNHGATRLGNLPGFADAMVGAMEGAWMPEFLVRITALLVSPIELIFGLFLILGLFTRISLIITFVLMAVLMYGVTIVQNWDTASSQLIYNLALFILLAGVGYNRFALDNILFKGDHTQPSSASDNRLPQEGMRFGLFRLRRLKHPHKYRNSSSKLKA